MTLLEFLSLCFFPNSDIRRNILHKFMLFSLKKGLCKQNERVIEKCKWFMNREKIKRQVRKKAN